MADLTHAQYKRLRDMTDGHLNLFASVRRYDETTGDKLDQPELLYIGHDRPDITDRDWWKPLLAEGLIALPDAGGTRCTTVARCTVTLEGRKAIGAYPETGADRD